MKVIFWILAVLLIPVYLLFNFLFVLSGIVGSYDGVLGVIGEMFRLGGTATAIIGFLGIALGIWILVKKKNVGRAYVCLVLGLGWGFLMLCGTAVVDGIHSVRFADEAEQRLREQFGENWDSPSAIEGLPALYEEKLNMFYAVVTQGWTAEEMMNTDLFSGAITGYYGDSPAENIGFALMDLDADGDDELLIGAVHAEGHTATPILTVFADETNPFAVITSHDREYHYLHKGENGLYLLENCGYYDSGEPAYGVWSILPGQPDALFRYEPLDTDPDPAGRLTVELTPFSAFK